jgi:hypothetical protein
MPYVLSIAFFFLPFFAHGAPPNVTLELREGKATHRFLAHGNVPLEKLSLEGTPAFVSLFTRPEGESGQLWTERRKKAFLQLFQDDRNPYTGLVSRRKRCLGDATAKGVVYFHSGPPPQWADCKSSKAGSKAFRIWAACPGVYVEMTVLSLSAKKAPAPRIECQREQKE